MRGHIPRSAGTYLILLGVTTLVILAGVNVSQTATGESSPYEQFTPGAEVAPESDAPVVVSSQEGHLIGVHANGTVWRHYTQFDAYWDVDPVPGTQATFVYVGTEQFTDPGCATPECVHVTITEVNLTTNTTRTVYSQVNPVPDKGFSTDVPTRWHDVDALGPEKYLVADIWKNRVMILDTSTGQVEWQWQVRQGYDPLDSGGAYPYDWAHLNDVEYTAEGIMVSLRNHDSVVFVDQDEGIRDEMTLGCDGCYGVLDKQHNPDYIPRSEGGPALLVADSENHRIVEYQREDGEWKKSWTWSDQAMNWPRDADRLPDGRTLVTDTRGGRVVVVDQSGEVTWELEDVPGAYEAERLGLPDESDGPSATEARLESNVKKSEARQDDGGFEPWLLIIGVIDAVVPETIQGLIWYYKPGWLSLVDILLLSTSIVLISGGGLWNRSRFATRIRSQ